MSTFEQAAANLREEAAILRRNGHVGQAQALERACDELTAGAEEFVAWLTEDQAMTYTGRSAAWLRGLFGGWVERGLAKTVGRVRYYRRAVLIHRGNAEAARAAGRNAVKGQAA